MPERLPQVLAVGAWLKNAACRLDADGPRFSALHGDLGTPDACAALEASAEALLAGAPRPVAAIAHDLHPDFFSTRLALRLAERLGVPAIGVQHHHAHIEAVRAEQGLREPVIGLALDGVGLGTDGQAWGGELLRVDDRGWQRLGHLWPLALPGGDTAAREPWRMAAAGLHALGRGDEIGERFAPVVGATLARGVQQMLARGLNCPPTSSTGRWFDAAAGALGLSVRQADEAEAAIALERRAARWLAANDPAGPAESVDARADGPLDLRPLLRPLLRLGTQTGIQPAAREHALDEAAAAFHLGLADALATWATTAARRLGIATVCLGGGCFFNRVLTARITQRLEQAGLQVRRPLRHSAGDAGLALGQAWAAALALRAAAAATSSPDLCRDLLPCA